MRNRDSDPRRLDLRRLAQDAIALEGQVALSSFRRLTEGLPADQVASVPPVTWRSTGELRRASGDAPQVWLHLHAEAVVPLQCQRCLQPMTSSLSITRSFRFVADEKEAARIDEACDDDVLVLERDFNLLDLIEDELILNQPIVPRHERCPHPLLPDDSAAQPVMSAPENERPNPFAALASIRQRSKPD